MKAVHWNLSKVSRGIHALFSVKRYEDELFENMSALSDTVEIERIRRVDNTIIGSVPLSWLLQYRRRGADIIHATFQTLAPAVYIAEPNKSIITVHDLTPIVYPAQHSQDISFRIQWLFSLKALRKVDRIIAVSEFAKKEIVRLAGVTEFMVDVVHQGADSSKYYPMDRKECRRRFGLSTEDKHVLVVASNLQHKRMDLALKAFDEARRRRNDLKLMKSGYGQALVGEGIINTGWVPEPEMPILYNCADVFLHTSEYEGFGLPVLEAMSCGIPVVASNAASGNMVDLAAEDVVERFVEGILSSIDKGRDEKAIERSKSFSWRKTAQETLSVYEKVCAAL